MCTKKDALLHRWESDTEFRGVTGFQICLNSGKRTHLSLLNATHEFEVSSQSLYNAFIQMHAKKTFRCRCLPLSLPLAPATRQVYVAAIKRIEGRAGLARPRDPDGTPAHSLTPVIRPYDRQQHAKLESGLSHPVTQSPSHPVASIDHGERTQPRLDSRLDRQL